MKRAAFYSLFLVLLSFFLSDPCFSQKEKIAIADIDTRKIPRISIAVKSARFQSNEAKNARAEYLNLARAGQKKTSVIATLKKKGHMNTAILAAIRQNLTSNQVNNTEVAEDVQLMLKAIPTLTAAEMITAIRDLYEVSAMNLFNIAVLASQDSTVRVSETRYMSYKCDCTIRNPSDVGPARPFRKTDDESHYVGAYYKKLYPWECFDYWNTGFRAVILPETNLNSYLRLMRLSEYPLYEGMTSTDLADPSLDFKVIMGNTSASLSELMECAAVSGQTMGYSYCHMEIPTQTTTSYNGDFKYSASCKHPSIIKTRFQLKTILTVLKRNGISVATMTNAAKTRFNPTDDDMKQRIIASFDTTVFTAAEILEASNVLNTN